MVIAKC
jgi:hypothetical protein